MEHPIFEGQSGDPEAGLHVVIRHTSTSSPMHLFNGHAYANGCASGVPQDGPLQGGASST